MKEAYLIFVAKEMVFPNHINYCDLMRPFFATGKWSYETIILIKFLQD
jgi:hypothetical protein